MNQAMVSKIVSLVPERMARLQSGTRFKPSENEGAQVASLAPLLHWLTPLNAIGEEEQRALGLHVLHGKAARRDDEDDDEREEISLPT